VGGLDGVQKVVSGIVHTRNNVAVALSVGGPEHNNAVKVMVLLELANISPDVVKVCLFVVSGNKIISTRFLVGGDEVRVINGREWFAEQCHVGSYLALEVIVKDFSTLHSLVERKTRDIPTSKDKIIRVDHGEDIGDGDMDFLAIGIGTNADGRSA
jgi:hypothetical protein